MTTDELYILVPGEEVHLAPDGVDDGVEEQGPVDWVQRVLVRRERVDLARVKNDLERIQAQARHLLEAVSLRELGGMRLAEVQLQLGINAEGSLGVVTAGVEAAITLTYRQADPSA